MATLTFDSVWKKAKESNSDKTIEIVEHGWEQHVLVDLKTNIVYRYPRNQNAKLKLDDEVSVLKSLNKIPFDVKIPKIIQHQHDFSSYQYIPGSVMDPSTISQLSDEQIAEIGSGLGKFLAKLHETDPQVLEAKKTKQTMSLYQYYRSRIDHAKTKEFYKHACELLSTIEKNQTDQVVVHGDLHGLNMVIDPKTKKLVGVIDFSELELGNRYQDFRKLFMTEKRLLSPALKKYEEITDVKLDKKVILAWAYVNEWANIAYFNENPMHPTYIRALNHLKRWGEL